jgi:phytoene/squalene synthetase
VLEALAEARASHPHMAMSTLSTLLAARERDLAYPSFATLDELATFASDTQAPLILAVATALDDDGDAGPDRYSEASRSAGEAVGLTVLLRGAPAHAASRLSYVPRDVLRDTGVPASAVVNREADAARKAYAAIAARADRAVVLADDAVAELGAGKKGKAAFWGLELPRIYGKRLRQAGGNVFDERLQRSMKQTYPLVLQLRLLGRKMLRR